MGVITNLIRTGMEKKDRDQQNQVKAFEMASKSDDPQLRQWGIQSLVDLGQKYAPNPEVKKHIPVLGQIAQLMGNLNPMPKAAKPPEGPAPQYSQARADAEQARQADIENQLAIKKSQAVEAEALRRRKAQDEQDERQKLTNEQLEWEAKSKHGQEIGLTGDALKRYQATGQLPARYGEEAPTGTRKPVTIVLPDGTASKLMQDNTGKLFNVGGEPFQPPPGSRFQTEPTKLTDVDKVANHLLLSGRAGSKEDASKQAATLLADADKAKAKAAAGGGVVMTPGELGALAQWQIATGQTPAFGLGANNPNRTAYQKVFANMLSGGAGGVGESLEARAGFRAGAASLNQLTQAKGKVGSFERNARANIERAVKLSNQVGRTGSKLANEYIQWTQGNLEDYPQLAAFRVAVDTAAKDYALVTTTASMGGVSTDSARQGALSLFNEHMPSGALEAAAESMYADMDNRIHGLDAQIEQAREGIRTGAPKPGGGGGGQTPSATPGTPDPNNPLGLTFPTRKQ